MNRNILGKSYDEWVLECPIIRDITELNPVLWLNPGKASCEEVLPGLPYSIKDIEEAEARWNRFAPLLERLFPETAESRGIIESNMMSIPNTKAMMEQRYGVPIKGKLFLKCDNYLPVAGSIKARGGIYEVLKHAEELVLKSGMLGLEDNYAVLAEERFREFFSRHHLAVGSTGNLGMSIGIMGSALGFRVTVHMSSDAKEWKKGLLRSRGVEVIEYATDYSKAVEEGRKQSLQNPMSYFIDDENSIDLFMGYSAAAFRLKGQLEAAGVAVDRQNPLYVYLPCGVGGAPGGICFGLKNVFGDSVRCFFVEPTHSPCMLLGMVTGLHEGVSVGDFGIDNVTEADGLAVGRPSGLVGRLLGKLIDGIYTIDDNELYRLLVMVKDGEDVKVEPSAAAGLPGPFRVSDKIPDSCRSNVTHLAWATGGLFVPGDMYESFYEKGKKLLNL
ncbi:MAG: D-serine ammonia-lyase [Firmicutes bacterium]|nr:D-serine ammonia-lyase [Bacillota bacterium]MDI6705428.1 D-serine ammonia-lyase [Bacillota bacterium]